MHPFSSRDSAAYWGGGTVVEAASGGFWAIGGRNTTDAPELYHVGRKSSDSPDHDVASAEGWPDGLTGYVWATPIGGGSPQVCRTSPLSKERQCSSI